MMGVTRLDIRYQSAEYNYPWISELKPSSPIYEDSHNAMTILTTGFFGKVLYSR